MNYKRLGDYIQPVNNRNKGMVTDDLRGLSMTKEFRKSTSNIIGTDLTKYKLVNKNQFACDFMSVIRVHKLPVVLHQEEQPVIVSGAYTVFEVIDQNILNPEYLMMWFRRPEFDRYADFRCDSAIRGGFKWDELCDTQLPIPSIKKQQQIVDEYNTVTNRIQLNEKININLEATAQALYKHWFVDFEFPNAEGKPYKSSGGEMVYNEELDKEIPVGWSVERLNHICNITSSKRVFEREYTKNGVPFYRAGEIRQKKEGKPIQESLFISEKRYNEIVSKFGQPIDGDILMTAVGSLLGDSYLVKPEKFYFKDGNVIWLKDFKIPKLNFLIYTYLQSEEFEAFLDEIRIGSGQSAITIKGLGEKMFLIPQSDVLNGFSKKTEGIYEAIYINICLNTELSSLQSLLLAKMTQSAPKKVTV